MTRLLRTDLPDEVWYRLNDEARAADMTIGVLVKRLILARDRKMHPPISDASDTGPTDRRKS